VDEGAGVSNFLLDTPCPGCGHKIMAWDVRGQRGIWTPLPGETHVYGCATCKRYWLDPELTQERDWPEEV